MRDPLLSSIADDLAWGEYHRREAMTARRRAQSRVDLRDALKRANRMDGRGSVAISWLTGGQPRWGFMNSVLDLWALHPEDPLRRRIAGRIAFQSSPRIAETRSQIVDHFLLSDEINKPREAEWLLMVDDDMTWTIKDFATILETADPNERPIVGGLCFVNHKGLVEPTLYRMWRDPETRGIHLDRYPDVPDTDLVRVGATGAAFLLIHRKVLLKMRGDFYAMPGADPADPNPVMNPYPWFAEGHVDHAGRGLGEDVIFCLRAQASGFPIYVDTRIRIGHIKEVALTYEMYQEQRQSIRHRSGRVELPIDLTAHLDALDIAEVQLKEMVDAH